MITELVRRFRRRRHPRVSVETACGLEVPRWSGRQAQTLDVSAGGIALRLPDTVSIGDRLIFSMARTGEAAIEILGEVRHVQEMPEGDYLVGLRWAANEEKGRRVFQAVTRAFSQPGLDAA